MNDDQKQDFTWREVGDRIKRLRVAAGMTQARLAETAGLTQGGIFAIERGDTNPQLSSLQAIARVFGVTVRNIVCGFEPRADSVADRAARLLNQIFESADPLAMDVVMAGLKNGLRIAQYHANINHRPDSGSGIDAPTMRILKAVETAIEPKYRLVRGAAPSHSDNFAGHTVGRKKLEDK